MSRVEQDLVEWLGDATSGAEALGGKGASLNRLARLGYRVPPGFCVTTAAFRAQRVTEAPGLAEVAIDPTVGAALAAAVERLVALVAGSFPGLPRFAVRSSASGEDGSTASYAGLHDTELDVRAIDISAAVRRCWASLWSAPAVAYRERRGLSDEAAEMAVVVQALVPADASAVVFTRHPVTGRDDQLVITTARGLGDAMVAGTITPDTYVIDRSTRAVVTFEPGEDPAGPAVQPAHLAELIDLSLAVEADFEHAIDVEAASSRDAWFLLQARPITTGRAGQASAADAATPG